MIQESSQTTGSLSGHSSEKGNLRFVDASVFLHAYLRPAGRLPPEIETLKRNAQGIVERIAKGEPVLTTLAHLSEIANILEARVASEKGFDILSGLLGLPNLEVSEQTRALYAGAVEEARVRDVWVNDALAYLTAKERGISEVYSFETDFDKLEGLRRISK